MISAVPEAFPSHFCIFEYEKYKPSLCESKGPKWSWSMKKIEKKNYRATIPFKKKHSREMV